MSQMRISEPYVAQRPLDNSRVKYLLENFDPEKMKAPHVSFRDGVYWIMDGQHTFEALKMWLGEWKDQVLRCFVYTGLTLKDEAKYFRVLNDQKAVSAFAKYRAGVTAEEETETAIEKIIATRGLVVTNQSIAGAIGCVSTLQRVFKRDGEACLNRSLKLAHDAWGDPGLESVVIDGLGLFTSRYNGNVDDDQAIRLFGGMRGGVKGFVGQAEQMRMKTGGTKASCIAATAVTIVNRERTGKNRLPSWFK